jgi:hypothetical protein
VKRITSFHNDFSIPADDEPFAPTSRVIDGRRK